VRVAALIALFLLAAAQASAETDYSSCRSVKVVDGDTLDVECSGETIRVRLLRVDTPERKDAGFEGARDALASLVEGEKLRLEFEEEGVAARGNYGRLLAYIFVGDLFVNEELIRDGWSEFWTKYGRGRYADVLEAAEDGAEPRARGSLEGDEPPRDECCRTCRKGTACGDSCIAASSTCRKGRGCACDALD
jgi:micrococcal nuclease